MLKLVSVLVLILTIGSGNVWGETTTYTFSSKSWAASPANWTSGKDGNALTSGRGIQVTTGASGANGTSPISFTNVSQVVVTYSTNASAGVGSIAVQIGSNTASSQSVTKTGGTTDRSLTYNFSPNQTGKVKVTVTCTTNSIYVKSVAITTASAYTVVWTINPAAGGSLSATSGTSTTVTPNSAYTYGSPAYTVTTGSATVSQSPNTFTATPSANCTIRINMVEKPKYTVTLMDDGDTRTQASYGASVTLPSRTGCTGYTFAGWTKTWVAPQSSWTTTAPTIIPAGSYTPSANENLYPVYTKTESGGSSTITFTPGTETGSTSVTKSGVTCTMSTMNNASYYQIYASASGTFSVASGNITAISFTCTASGTSKYGPGNASANVGTYSYSGSTGSWEGSASSVTISSTAQIRMTTLSVTCSGGSTTYYISVPNCCTDPGLAYATGSVTKTYGASAFTNTLTNSHSVAVTYGSSDTDVATVAADGTVTIKQAGSTTITASSAAQTVAAVSYCADEASYTLTVNKASISPTLTYTPNSVAVGENTSAPTVGGNPGSGGVTYAITSASPAGCATINTSTGVVSGVAVGSVTVTATVAATANYNGGTATATVTINAAAYFPNNKTVFIQGESSSAWDASACVKAWFNASGAGGAAQTTYWLFDATDGDAGKKLYATIVPATGNLNQVTLQRFASNCSDFWNNNGTLTKASDGGSNTFRSTGSGTSNVAWNGTGMTLDLKGDPNSWGSSLGTFADQGNGVWTATYDNYAPANAAGESQEFKISTNYNGWIGNTGSNNNATLDGMHVGSTYNITATLDVKDHSLTMSKTFVKGTVHFNLQGHGSAISDLTNVAAGSKISAPGTPSATGYDFGGWYKEPACTNAWNFASDVVNETMTLYAKWTKHTYTITSTLNNCSSSPAIPSSYEYTGSAASLSYTITPSSGYRLPTTITVSGTTYTWNSTTGALVLTGIITSNVTITITAVQTHTVTWKSNGENYGDPVVYDHGATLVLPASDPSAPSSCSEKVFVGWTAHSEITSETSDAPVLISAGGAVNSDATYRAVFADEEGGGTTTIFAEPFSDYNGGSKPSSPGASATVLAGQTISYTFTNGTGTGTNTTIVQDDNNGPYNHGKNVLIRQKNGSLKIDGISTNSQTSLSLSYEWRGSGTMSVTSSTNVSVGSITTDEDGDGNRTCTATITVTSGSTFWLTFTNTSTSANLRFDSPTITCSGVSYDNYITQCCALKPVTNLAVSGTTANSVTLSWTAPSPTTGIDHLELRNASTDAKIGSNIAVGTTTTSVSGLVECNTYSYKIVSVGASCETSSDAIEAQPFSGAKTVTYKYHDDVTADGSFTTDCTHSSTTLPNPSREGYTLNGWYTAASGGSKIGDGGASYTPSANITLHAQWSQTNYTVTMAQNPAAGATLTGGTTTAHAGNTINISTDVPSGYRFTGWTSSPSVTFASSSSTSTSFTMPASNVTVTANFVQIHTVSFSIPTGGGTVVSPPSTVDHGGTLTFPNVTDVDCGTFLGWTTAANSSYSSTSGPPTPLYAAAATTTINDAATFYAVYSKLGDNPVAATLYAHSEGTTVDNTGYTNVTITTNSLGVYSNGVANDGNYKVKFDAAGDYIIFELDGTPTSFNANFRNAGAGTAGNTGFTLYQSSSTSGPWAAIGDEVGSDAKDATYSLNITNAALFSQRVLKLAKTSHSLNTGMSTITINGLRAPITYTTAPSCVDWRLQSIAVTTAPTKTTYDECEEFDPAGMVVTATMYDNDNPETTTTKAVAGYTWTPEQFLTPGNAVAVTISYTEKGVTKTTTQTVRVNDLTNYTVTFHDGNRTPVNWTQTNHCESVDLDDYTGALECGDYTFVGWSTSSTTYNDQAATITTWVSGEYLPTANTDLYAVYRKGSAGATFTANCDGGTYYIYEANGNTHMAGRVNATPRAYTSEYWNNDGGTGCVACLDEGSDLTPFTFTRIAENTYKIQNSAGEYLRKYSSGNHPDFESTWHNEDNFKWMISTGTNGSWRFVNKAATDYALVKSGSYFDFQLASNVTALSSYYDLELEPAASTVYQSNPNCASTYTITFNTYGGTFDGSSPYEYGAATTVSDIASGTHVHLPSASYPGGWTFVGWKESKQDESIDDFPEDSDEGKPVSIIAAGTDVTITSDKIYHAVYHFYDDDWTFDALEGGTYHMYFVVSDTKHYAASTPTNSWAYLSTSTDCDDAKDITITPGTGANAGKYSIAVDGYTIIPQNEDTKFKRGEFWWTITDMGDGTYAIGGMNDKRHIMGGNSGTTFEHVAYNSGCCAYTTAWHYPSFGRCRQHHWTSEPTPMPTITLGSTGPLNITSTNGKTTWATSQLTVRATHYEGTTKLYLSCNVAGVGFLSNSGSALSSDAHGTYIQTDASGDLATTNIIVTYSPSVSTDGIEHATITVQDNSSPSILATATRTLKVRHLPTKFIIAEKVGDDWYALPNNMSNSQTNPAKVKISSVNETTGVATIYSDVTDHLAWAMGMTTQSAKKYTMEFYSDLVNDTKYLKTHTSDANTIGQYAKQTGTNQKYTEFKPTTSDLVDYTLYNEQWTYYLGISGDVWGVYSSSATVRFFTIDQQPAPTITWQNDMWDVEHANHTFATNKAENGIVSLPAGTPPSCNEPSGMFTFDGWVTETWSGYRTTGFTKVNGGEVATSDVTYYAVFKTASNHYYTQCPTIYSITYTPNGGTGSNYVVYTMNTTADAVTVETAGFTKEGSTFVGWTNPSDGEGTIITPGTGKITGLSGDITLNAVWIGTVSVTGTVRLTASAGEKVATGATDVTISSTDLACATALRITYKDVTNDVTYGRTGSPTYTTSEFRLCDGSYNSADGGNISLAAVTGAYNQTFSMTYEPNGGANTLDEYELKVEVLLKNTVLDTKTLSLYGRTLPASFAIAIKVGGSWYALPNNMGAEGTYDPVLISVTEDASVLNWTAQGPSTVAYKMKDYTPNYSKLRFAANDANEYCLWAATGNAAGIRNYSASSTDNNYAWTVTPDANFNAYTMANVANTREALKIYNLKWEMYNTGGFSAIHFIPLTTVTPIDVTVMEWGVDEIAVKTVANWTPSAISAQISGGTPSAVTKTAIGGDLYKLTGVGNLKGNPGEPLALNITDGGAKQAIIQIPFIVTDTKTEADLAGLMDGATLADKRAIAKDIDVVVRSGGTLSSSSSASGTFKDLYIYPGGKADFSKDISIQNVYMRGGFSWLSSTYALPQMNVASGKSISGIGSTGHGVFYDLYLDNSIYYVMALPKDVALSAVTNEINTDDFDAWIKEYSGEGRTLTPKVSGWKYITTSDIKRGVGYEIAIKPRISGRPYGILRFPLLKSTAWSDEAVCEPSVTGWGCNSKTVTDNNKGWNFIGNPFLTSYHNTAVLGTTMQTKTLVHHPGDPWNGKWDWSTDDVKYLTIPRYTEYEYDDVRALNTKLDAFYPFFIQVTGDGTLSFSASNRALKMPALYSEKKEREVIIDFNLENPSGITDIAGLTISNQYSEEFDMDDKEKTIQNGNATLKVYTLVGEFRTAFNSLPEAVAAQSIPVGYIANEAGDYTFSLVEGNNVEEVEHIWLTDHEVSPEYTTDLIDDTYSFRVKQVESNNTRFTLQIELKDEQQMPTDIDNVQGGESEHPLKFLYKDKMYILRNGVLYDATGKRVSIINR